MCAKTVKATGANMPDGNHPATPADLPRLTDDEREAIDDGYTTIPAAPPIKPFLVHQLDRVENAIESGSTREALALLAVARCRAETLEGELPASSRPMTS